MSPRQLVPERLRGWILLGFGLACVPAASQTLPPASGPTPKHWQVLLDLRADNGWAWSAVSDNDAEAILDRVYPQPERLRPGQECDADGNQFQPTIAGRAVGSFTAPHRQQTAHFIDEGWCSAPGGNSPGAVAVFEGQRVVATVEVGGYYLARLVDLDKDGTHELLMSWYGVRFGGAMTGTSLVSLAGGKLTEIRDFGEVLIRECKDTGAVEPRGIEAAVLYYVPADPGKLPTEYHREAYTAPCDDRSPSDYELVSRDGEAK